MSADGRLHQESRQRRAGQFPVLIRTLGIPRHLVAYRGDNQSCRILYPINGLGRKAISSPPRWSSSASIVEWSLKNSDFDIEQFVSKDGCGTRHSVRRTAMATAVASNRQPARQEEWAGRKPTRGPRRQRSGRRLPCRAAAHALPRYYYRREDVCGSRATPLAIVSSAVCLRIDDFATSDQMGAKEKSRPV